MKKILSIILLAVLTIGLLGSCKKGESKISVQDISLNKTAVTLNEGEAITLVATVTPAEATDKSCTWSSDKESVATVDQQGNVKAVAEGDATITVTTTDGGKTASCTVTVNKAKILPEKMYMIGNFCGWDWNKSFEMTKINGSTAKFWTLAYLVAGEGFKFCSKKEWSGDFCQLDVNNGFKIDGSNCIVENTGIYNVAVDYENMTIDVAPAHIYGIGDCFGGWDAKTYEFTYTDNHASISAEQAGYVRMYAESEYYNTDWWRQEFNIFNGKIVFRGNGGDQDPVIVAAGQTIDLNLSDQTGSFK